MPAILNMEAQVMQTRLVRRPRAVLVDVATEIPWSDRFRMSGITFQPNPCNLGDDKPVMFKATICDDVIINAEAFKDLEDWVVQPTFGMLAALQQSAICEPGELDEVITNRLDVYGSAAIANELMTGSASTGASFKSTADVLNAAAVKPVVGLALLEQGLADLIGNATGVIHLPLPSLLPLPPLLQVDGNRITTTTGHDVVIDGGYTGKVKPDSGGALNATALQYWAYASGPVAVSTSPLPDTLSGSSETWGMSRNLRRVFADQYGVVVFDPCAVAAVLIDVAA